MVGFGDGIDLKLAVDFAHGRVELQRDLASGGVDMPVDAQSVAVELGAVGDEAHLRVVLDVEEVARAQVLVALGQLRIRANITRADIAAFLLAQATDTRFHRAAPAISN